MDRSQRSINQCQVVVGGCVYVYAHLRESVLSLSPRLHCAPCDADDDNNDDGCIVVKEARTPQWRKKELRLLSVNI